MLTVLRHDVVMPILSQCKLATARSCLRHLIERYDPEVVFMPEMAPDGVVDPFAHRHFVFYRLHGDLSPDLDAIRTQCARYGQFKRPLFIAIDYFGYAYPLHDLVAFAHHVGGLVLEDCAHGLTHPKATSSCSDLTLYSLNKVLPVPDGALLASHTPHVDVTMPVPPEETLPDDVLNAYLLHMNANRCLSLQGKGSDASLSRIQSTAAYDQYYRHISSNMLPKRCSRYAMAAWENLDFREFVLKRRDNAKRIIRHLKRRQMFRPHEYPVFALPVICRDRHDTRQRLYDEGIAAEYLKERWRPPGTWEASEFWDNHLLLPIHEKMTDAEIAHVGKTARWYA